MTIKHRMDFVAVERQTKKTKSKHIEPINFNEFDALIFFSLIPISIINKKKITIR